MMRKTFLTSALDMPEIMSYIYNKSWKLQFSASSSIIIIEDFYLQTFLHSLEEVENDAKSKGAKLIHLDTFDFQAKEFYEKQGYIVFGILENCPEKHYRYYLKKVL